MNRKSSILALFAAMLLFRADAQIYDTNGDYVQTFAGSGFYGYVDGVGELTMFNNPTFVVADSTGNVFVWDSNNHVVRRIALDTTVSTFAGGGGLAVGTGTNVSLGSMECMTIDKNNAIWAILSTGGLPLYLYQISSNATITRTNLPNSLSSLQGICPDSLGNLYISDWAGNKIYRYDTNGTLSVFAGSGNPGYADGNGIFTAFSRPEALAADAADNIYVWDSGNYLIRIIDQARTVTTFAGTYGNYFPNADGTGTNSVLSSVAQLCVDGSGNVLLVGGSCVRKISPGTNVTTLAGSFTQGGYTNGAGNLARFSGASGICISGDTVYVADTSNQRIRSITNNPTAQPVLPANLQLNTYPGLQITGTVGRTYQIQTSPDMSNWTAHATILLNSTPYLWIDQNPVAGSKFYRALLLP